MKRIAASVMLLLLLGQPVTVYARQSPVPETNAGTLSWRGEHRWRLVLDDGEIGSLRLGFVQTPAGDYLLTGDLLLDDARLGVTGSARRDGDRLVLDMTMVGALRNARPDPSKQALYPKGQVPKRVSSAGFAMVRAELVPETLEGLVIQYQTNIVTGDHVQGPVLRTGRLETVAKP
jgi:hypothetical protein